MRKKIVFFSGSRADYGLIQSIIKNAVSCERLEAVLIRVGHSLQDNCDFDGCELFTSYKLPTRKGVHRITSEDETVLAIGQIIQEVGSVIHDLSPDLVFVPGDRFEILACVIGCYYQRIPIAHIFGGDRSQGGHLDDNVRHAITKLSHLHFTVCSDSYDRVIQMGEEDWRVYNFGSPVVDNLSEINFRRPTNCRYCMMTFHPVTTIPEQTLNHAIIVLDALAESGLKAYITSPNNEYGSEEIMSLINDYVEKFNNLDYKGNLGWKNYLNYLKFATFVIGNSSSGLLEAPILGTPSIDVGNRQEGRFAPSSVIRVPSEKAAILKAIQQVCKGTLPILDHPYGSGGVSKRIIDTILEYIGSPDLLKKKITY